MPETGSKKRSQQPGSGKLSKRGASLENAPVAAEVLNSEEVEYGNVDVPVENNDIDTVIPIPEPLKDVMRTEPILSSVFIDDYCGECDENGFYHGEGNIHLKDGMVYTGIFQHGKMHSHGFLKWPNGASYVGDFEENVISGSGTYSWTDGSTYKGEVLNGLRHGMGTFICADLKTYTGQWKYGKRHGKGIVYYDESGLSYYNGDWYNNEKCGYGIRRFANGNTYEGEWKENMRNGSGTMYWNTNDQEYSGNWVNGIQNGHGEYLWYLKRVSNSQYPLRNKYVGNFLNGERHGHGIFYYASGAIYDGEWKHDMKHGKGKFTFKNGSTFLGQFHNDHMIDFPDLILPRMMTPDIAESGIPVKSAMSLRSKSVMGMTQNAVDAFLDINLDDIFDDYAYDLEERQEEVENIMRIILRLTTQLKSIYKVYSCLGSDLSVDNTFVMSKCQFLRFLKDYDIHKLGLTVTEIDRYLEESITLGNCFKELFIRDFLNYLVKMSYLIFKTKVANDASVISNCFSELVACIVEKKDVIVKGYVFKSIKRTQEIYKFVDKIFEVYFYFSGLYYPSLAKTLTLRDILMILKDMNLINENFNSTKLVNILTQEDQDEDGYFNLENEITPFEFLEVIVGSSSVFITDEIIEKHRPSHVVPMLSLDLVNTDTQVSFIDKIEKEIIVEDDTADKLPSVNQEEIPPIEINVESSTLSPVKSSKSGKKMNRDRKISVGKKVEKDISSTNVSKSKKDGSKSGRKTSSIKLDDAKTRSISTGDVDSSEHNANQENILPDKSFENTVENMNCISEDAILPSFTELVVESSVEIEMVNQMSSEKLDPEPEKLENFELWSLRLNLFLNEYLFPAYDRRKNLEEMVSAKGI